MLIQLQLKFDSCGYLFYCLVFSSSWSCSLNFLWILAVVFFSVSWFCKGCRYERKRELTILCMVEKIDSLSWIFMKLLVWLMGNLDFIKAPVRCYGVMCNIMVLGATEEFLVATWWKFGWYDMWWWFTWLGSQRNHPINNNLDAKRNQDRPKRDQAREESIFGIQSQDRVAAQPSDS